MTPEYGVGWDGYGEIVSVRPMVVNFGDFKFDIGDFTFDQRCIGEFIHIVIGERAADVVFHPVGELGVFLLPALQPRRVRHLELESSIACAQVSRDRMPGFSTRPQSTPGLIAVRYRSSRGAI